jgi:hypothetical protein
MAFLYLTLLPFNSSIDDSDPDVFMWTVFVALLVELPVLAFYMFDPRRMRKRIAKDRLLRRREATLALYGLMVSLIAAVLAVTPAMFGLVLYLMSGDAWRVLLLLPLTALTAWVLWNRAGRVINALADSGLT